MNDLEWFCKYERDCNFLKHSYKWDLAHITNSFLKKEKKNPEKPKEFLSSWIIYINQYLFLTTSQPFLVILINFFFSNGRYTTFVFGNKWSWQRPALPNVETHLLLIFCWFNTNVSYVFDTASSQIPMYTLGENDSLSHISSGSVSALGSGCGYSQRVGGFFNSRL